ncbi:hypothetical protein MPQ_2011 [Methylovorus sp. MP688]|nr:hypothetical protein MPQ_2011 [Methylovorus sp. MP688]
MHDYRSCAHKIQYGLIYVVSAGANVAMSAHRDISAFHHT